MIYSILSFASENIYLIGVFDGLLIMTYFFVGIFNTDNGVTCSDVGFDDLSTPEECSAAVSYAKNLNSKAHFSLFYYRHGIPKGCAMDESGPISFSTDPGKRESSYTSICKNGNTQF